MARSAVARAANTAIARAAITRYTGKSAAKQSSTTAAPCANEPAVSLRVLPNFFYENS
jgi:hypothetical protein